MTEHNWLTTQNRNLWLCDFTWWHTVTFLTSTWMYLMSLKTMHDISRRKCMVWTLGSCSSLEAKPFHISELSLVSSLLFMKAAEIKHEILSIKAPNQCIGKMKFVSTLFISNEHYICKVYSEWIPMCSFCQKFLSVAL